MNYFLLKIKFLRKLNMNLLLNTQVHENEFVIDIFLFFQNVFHLTNVFV